MKVDLVLNTPRKITKKYLANKSINHSKEDVVTMITRAEIDVMMTKSSVNHKKKNTVLISFFSLLMDKKEQFIIQSATVGMLANSASLVTLEHSN